MTSSNPQSDTLRNDTCRFPTQKNLKECFCQDKVVGWAVHCIFAESGGFICCISRISAEKYIKHQTNRHMNHNSFLFVGAWMQPLRTLPLQQRWNVMEAIVEYSTSGSFSTSLDTMETVAFGFIRTEIDRMKHHRNKACMKRHPAANDHHNETCRKRQATASELREKRLPTAMQTGPVKTPEDSDAKACKALHPDAPYDIESVSESVSISESDETTSSTSSGVRARVTLCSI